MANPQIENGHIDIAHEIGEALARINLSAYESRVLWVIFRQTYGWHKPKDAISLGQFEKRTGILRHHINRTIKALEKRNIITVTRGNRVNIYQFQKNYELWQGSTYSGSTYSGSTYSGNKVVPIQVTEKVPIQVTTKENKETIQKKSIEVRKNGKNNESLKGPGFRSNNRIRESIGSPLR